MREVSNTNWKQELKINLMKLIMVVLIFLAYVSQKLHSEMEGICFSPSFMGAYASTIDVILDKRVAWHLVLSSRLSTDWGCSLAVCFVYVKGEKKALLKCEDPGEFA